MKYITGLLLISTLCVVFRANAQTGSGKIFYLIYIDNSKVTDNDGMNDVMKAHMKKVTDSVKALDARFVLYVSDRENFDMTDNPGSIERVSDNIANHSPRQSVNQKYDIKQLRELALDKIAKDQSRQVKIYFFLSADFCQKVADSYSPLINFFPKEMELYKSIKDIQVSVIYSKENSPNVTTKLNDLIDFYSKYEFKSSIQYKIIGL